jgi:hypothetical protein
MYHTKNCKFVSKNMLRTIKNKNYNWVCLDRDIPKKIKIRKHCIDHCEKTDSCDDMTRKCSLQKFHNKKPEKTDLSNPISSGMTSASSSADNGLHWNYKKLKILLTCSTKKVQYKSRDYSYSGTQ